MKPTVRISQWRVVPDFLAGGHGFVLMGLPENHPGLYVSNQKLIVSSPIVADMSDEGWVETLNTRYELVGPTASLDEIQGLTDKAFSTPPIIKARTALQ